MPGPASGYNEAAAERICARIAAGESLVRVCREAGMPARVTVRRWLAQHGEFRERYERARGLHPESGRGGRPTRYGKALAEEICTRIAEGEGLRGIYATPGMPSPSTVFRWIETHPEFRQSYGLARTVQAELYADEIIAIADAAADVALARLRIDARKWMAARLAPKKYGEAIKHEHSGTLTLEAALAQLDREAEEEARALAAAEPASPSA